MFNKNHIKWIIYMNILLSRVGYRFCYKRTEENPFILAFETLVKGFNNRLHKPREEELQQESNLLKKITSQISRGGININEFCEMLYQVRRQRLLSVEGLDRTQDLLNQHWDKMELKAKMIALNFMVSNRRISLWSVLPYTDAESTINNIYCSTIMTSQLPSLTSLPQSSVLWQQELSLLKNCLKSSPPEPSQQKIKRSPLEIEVQCFLKTLNVNFSREVRFNDLCVDFLVEDKIALQVLGSHHYTPDLQLKGWDIVRGLILSKWISVRFVHSQQLNRKKGLREKLDYIQYLLGDGRMPNQINWKLR